MISEDFLQDFFGMNVSDSLNIWRSQGASATSASTLQCPYCGAMPHANIGQCPAVQKIEYYPDGTIKSVEKKP